MPGTTSRMTRPGPVRTGGVKMGLEEFATTNSGCALPSRLWNERDPILKERLFGLTNSEGNHGEDVKEYYFYIDSTPTHSYMKYLYKYPQREFPYRDLVETNRGRSREELEYELLDTGIFDDDRYFDVFVEYAKAGSGRHTYSDHRSQSRTGNGPPSGAADALVPEYLVVGRQQWQTFACVRRHQASSRHRIRSWATTGLYCDGNPELLFTENETNAQRLWGQPNASPWVKDAFHTYVISGDARP